MELQHVRAVITGGASGLGHAVASHLIAAGAHVTLFDVNAEKGAAAAAALGANAGFAQVDVSNEAGVLEAMQRAQATMGGLNAAINCAPSAPSIAR